MHLAAGDTCVFQTPGALLSLLSEIGYGFGPGRGRKGGCRRGKLNLDESSLATEHLLSSKNCSERQSLRAAAAASRTLVHQADLSSELQRKQKKQEEKKRKRKKFQKFHWLEFSAEENQI